MSRSTRAVAASLSTAAVFILLIAGQTTSAASAPAIVGGDRAHADAYTDRASGGPMPLATCLDLFGVRAVGADLHHSELGDEYGRQLAEKSVRYEVLSGNSNASAVVFDGTSVRVKVVDYVDSATVVSNTERALEENGLSGYKVDLVGGGYASSDLCAVIDNILIQSPIKGLSMFRVGFETSGLVEIAISDPDSADVRALEERFGGMLQQSIVETEDVDFQSRRNDSNGYNAGAEIFNPTATCTAGFKATNDSSGITYLLTAGHCGNNNSPWYNGTTTSTFMGTMASNEFSSGSTIRDTAVLLKPAGILYTASVWRGSVSGYEVTAVRTAYPGIGAVAGWSGSTSGEKSATILDAPSCRTFGAKTLCNIVKAQNNTTRPCAEGDSGGPVFAFISGTTDVYAVGIHSAGSAVSVTTPPYVCYFSEIGGVLSGYGSHLG